MSALDEIKHKKNLTLIEFAIVCLANTPDNLDRGELAAVELAAKDAVIKAARELSAKWKRESAELTIAGGVMNAQLSVDIMFYAKQLDAALEGK